MSQKEAIRTRVWDRLEEAGLARFPFPPQGRITNFEGAAAAAERAMSLPALAEAEAVKANPDAPQLPLRRRLLDRGTTVYMAVPRLTQRACFLELDPAGIDDTDAAATVSKVSEFGVPRGPEAVPEIDAIVAGSVAVTEAGVRIGKGEGYSDLEYGVLREFDRVGAETPVVTTVHDEQVISEEVRPARHDVPIDAICTPTRTIRTDGPFAKPDGVYREDLTETQRAEIPVLEALE
ncbi:5-formyltetrahydrofolate cyclo-ligase [Natronomonas sp.]|uniref:5-formyltetrahydrofolate cyclo-ligase n=1 Tax=Natronomonas sp. TaxID=2184060 RepID=UPI002638BC20|nr:5-formyltetrahydrofolate cyclo-ligase [Natronomonas sp.]